MAAIRTEISEIVTGLAMFGYPGLDHALGVQPPAFRNVDADTYSRVGAARAADEHPELFSLAWSNGIAFARSDEALRGRTPWMIEWKGPHRPPGYDRIPADLRVDHVFLVSCKYGSDILMNSSPSNLFDRLLSDRRDEPTDWYLDVAPESYQALYRHCRELVDAPLPLGVGELTPPDREILKVGLPRRLSGKAQDAYLRFVLDVAQGSAARWRTALSSEAIQESTVWRLIRLESAPYYVVGESAAADAIGYRVVTPGDMRRTHQFTAFDVSADLSRGQPIVKWIARFVERRSGLEETVEGHVEVRWSHGKFAQVPEAKVYLDTPHHLVPGYIPLDAPKLDSAPTLF